MLGAGKFILQFRHFFLRRIENAAEFIRKTQISSGSVNFGTALQLRTQPVAQLIYIRSNLLKERSGYPLALIQKSGKKMFVGDVRMISLRSQILRSLQRFLHLLRVFIDAHAST